VSLLLLLFLTSAMLGVSGAVKLRATGRAGLSPSPLAIGEMLLALGIGLVALPGMADGSWTRWVVPAAVVLLLTSTVRHGMRLGEYRRRRADTEGGRLANYVKYVSQADGGPSTFDDGGQVEN
jgi:hypothetical protein